VSSFLKDATCKTSHWGHIEVIYNFVNCDNYKPAQNGIRAPVRGGEREDRHSKNLSNFDRSSVPRRGGDISAKSAPRMPAVLLMVGDGPERSMRNTWRATAAWKKKAMFLGSGHIEELMSCADVLLLRATTSHSAWWHWRQWPARFRWWFRNVAGSQKWSHKEWTAISFLPGTSTKWRNECWTSSGTRHAGTRWGRGHAKKRGPVSGTSIIIPQYEKYYERILACERASIPLGLVRTFNHDHPRADGLGKPDDGPEIKPVTDPAFHSHACALARHAFLRHNPQSARAIVDLVSTPPKDGKTLDDLPLDAYLVVHIRFGSP